MRDGLQIRFRQSSGGRTYSRRRINEELWSEQRCVRQSMPEWVAVVGWLAHLAEACPQLLRHRRWPVNGGGPLCCKASVLCGGSRSTVSLGVSQARYWQACGFN
jgi:hypothetical protein